MDLGKLASDIRDFEGVQRKARIGEISNVLGLKDLKETHLFGDDAAKLEVNGTLLFSCDSINEDLISADPFFAGYSAVLVNLNDIAAMGGRSIALVNVLSSKDEKTAVEIARGMKEASVKFGVPIVGGHFNPNSSHNGIEISVIGEIDEKTILRGSTAKPGDVIIAAIDLDGHLHSKYSFAWDCTSNKSPSTARANLNLLTKLAGKKTVNSCRDISNPGVIGTLGMLFEGSGVGGVVELEKIPFPEKVDFSHWLRVYPGFGFVFTSKESKADEVIDLFRKHAISVAVIGRVTEAQKLLISWRGMKREVFDLEKMSITGV